MENRIFSKSEISKIVKNFTKAYTFSSVGNSIISNVFVLFMTVGKGFTQKEISLILGVLPLISVFTFFIWGIILDKHKKLVFFNRFVTVINIITLMILLFVDNFTVFFILTLIRNIGMQPSGVANDEYLLNLSNKYNVAFGKIRVFGTIGYGIAGIITAVALIYLDSMQTKALALIFLVPALYYLLKLPEITESKVSYEKQIKEINEVIQIKEIIKNEEKDLKEGINISISVKDDNLLESNIVERGVSDKSIFDKNGIKLEIDNLNKNSNNNETNIENNGLDNKKMYLNFIELLKNKEYLKFISTFCLLTAVITSSVSYANPTLLIEFKAPESLIGLIPILMIIFEIILLAKIETFKIYKNINLMLIMATVLCLFRWFVLGATNSYWIVAIISLMHGIINGILLPLQNKLIWNIVPQNQHSTAFILTSLFCYTIFPALINLIIGGLVDNLGIKSFGIVYFSISLISLFILIKNPFKDGKMKGSN